VTDETVLQVRLMTTTVNTERLRTKLFRTTSSESRFKINNKPRSRSNLHHMERKHKWWCGGWLSLIVPPNFDPTSLKLRFGWVGRRKE